MDKILLFLYLKTIVVLILGGFLLKDSISFFYFSKKKTNSQSNNNDGSLGDIKKEKQKNIIYFIFGMIFFLSAFFVGAISLVPDTYLFFSKQIPEFQGEVTKFNNKKTPLKINVLYITTDNNKVIKIFVLRKNYNVGDYVKGEYFPNSKYGYAYSIK